jgi:hypothetical protein
MMITRSVSQGRGAKAGKYHVLPGCLFRSNDHNFLHLALRPICSSEVRGVKRVCLVEESF